MAMPVNERVRRWRERQINKGCRQLTILLDKESAERFDRLKAKTSIQQWNNSKLINMALPALEKEVDKTIKRQVLKKVNDWYNEGYSYDRIACLLNSVGVPTLTEEDEWNESAIRALLND